MATAAIGGSHLVASTQAGALFGWQLAGLILLVNVLKYPFFRFGVDYTLTHNESLLHGYFRKGRGYLWAFLLLNIVAAVVNTAGVLLLTASMLYFVIPHGPNVLILSAIILMVCLLILLLGKYRVLDTLARVMMVILAALTVLAVIFAMSQGSQVPADFVSPSPWELAALGFLVAMMGWMPAPIEISVINSIWVQEKRRIVPVSRRGGLFDFNLGYWVTAFLALCFLSLGALVQHGSEQQIAMAGVAFAQQLVNMYAESLGEWTRWIVALVAFFCMFGTTITVLDGYARGLHLSGLLLTKRLDVETPNVAVSRRGYTWLLLAQAAAGMVIILFFRGALSPMLTFAMTAAFLTTPFFAWLNFSLVRGSGENHARRTFLHLWAWVGLTYLIGFALIFIWYAAR
ncbi:NRAMP family divalent metal transporter [Aliidiomarina indica]|uniref:NRAMP family divalent metal transporter n=1 Tax=Aliidiomarina indica TaxID=2749147 RepID=UPI001E6181D3|nr:divalent metal cation transporter [Aliidiomarina indica]